MLEGTCLFGQGNDVDACGHHQIVNLETSTIAHETESWLG